MLSIPGKYKNSNSKYLLIEKFLIFLNRYEFGVIYKFLFPIEGNNDFLEIYTTRPGIYLLINFFL